MCGHLINSVDKEVCVVTFLHVQGYGGADRAKTYCNLLEECNIAVFLVTDTLCGYFN